MTWLLVELCSSLGETKFKHKCQTDDMLAMPAGVATAADQHQQDMQVGAQLDPEPCFACLAKFKSCGSTTIAGSSLHLPYACLMDVVGSETRTRWWSLQYNPGSNVL